MYTRRMQKSIGSAAYEAAYKALNTAQKAAVDTIEGPVMVMAGPGTGKTQILTLRIAHILQNTDTSPDAILALTYTNSGVAAMRERLKNFIGQDAYRVNIATFHGYASSVIESHPASFPRIIGASAADDVDRYDIVRTAIAKVGTDAIRPSGDPDYYVKPILSLVGSLKNDSVSVEDYEAFLKTLVGQEHAYSEEGEPTTKLLRSDTFCDVFREYERLMRERGLYDYSDMLVELIAAMTADPEFRLELAESAQYILADEHQDANHSQNTILEMLASAHPDGSISPNIFIVGDDKQAIYRFQGASLANFLFFRERFPTAVLIPLSENYRSTERILASAGKLMEGRSLKGELNAHGGEGEPLELILAETSEDEIAAVSTRIKELIDTSVAPSEIAVLFRRNRDIDALGRNLRILGIPFVSHRDMDALATAEITLLIALIRAAVDPEDTESLAKALFLPAFGLPTDLLARLFSAAKRGGGRSLFSLLKEETSAGAVVSFFEGVLKTTHTKNAIAGLDEVVSGSGFLSELMSADVISTSLGAYRSIRTLIETRSERDERYTLKDALSLISDLEKGIASITVADRHTGEGVALMSLHKSKGLEFEHVFLPHILESRFKPRADRSLFLIPEIVNQPEPDWDDERRLFYVGITRAKKRVYASAHTRRNESTEEKPLSFLSEVGELRETTARKVGDTIPRRSGATLGELKEEYKIVIDAFLKSGISATALNSYLSDPWECFFKNVVRLPETKAAHQMYGTSVHAALEKLYARVREGDTVDVDDFVGAFETALRREPLTSRDRAVYLAKGREVLRGYFEAYVGTWNNHAETEVAFAVNLPLSEGHERDHVHIRGFLDRMEVQSGAALVVDYKTGKVKSRNEILGATQSSDGSIHRQLVFYKLLLDLDGRYKLHEAMIDFVEPNPRGKYKREVFAVSEEEKEALVASIASMTDDLVRGDFLLRPSMSEDVHVRGLAEILRVRFSAG